MNLLSLVGPRLNNICQIRRKWYYLSGSKNLQSERGPTHHCRAQAQVQFIKARHSTDAETQGHGAPSLQQRNCMRPGRQETARAALARQLVERNEPRAPPRRSMHKHKTLKFRSQEYNPIEGVAKDGAYWLARPVGTLFARGHRASQLANGQ